MYFTPAKSKLVFNLLLHIFPQSFLVKTIKSSNLNFNYFQCRISFTTKSISYLSFKPFIQERLLLVQLNQIYDL